MKLALSYTASATDASDTLISAPDATHMSLDTVFQNSLLSVLKWEGTWLPKKPGGVSMSSVLMKIVVAF